MKHLCVALGFFFFGLGTIGAFLPVLPTVPFLLLAAYFFAKGSKRFNDWFIATKLYQAHLESFVRDRAMPLRSKLWILFYASSMLLFAFFMMKNIYGRVFILTLMAFKYYYFFFRIKTAPPETEKIPAHAEE